VEAGPTLKIGGDMTAPYVIMGAHDGIGEALMQALNADSLYVTARNPDQIQNANATAVQLDVLDSESMQKALHAIDQSNGIQGLAYCIGSIDLKPFAGASDQDFLKSFELNVLGAIRALRVLEKGLKKAKGSVVLFSTVAVQQGFRGHTIISTAKGALEGLVRSLAAEWAPDVRVNALAPSLTDTPLGRSLVTSDPMREATKKLHPIPRLGTPEEMAALAAFLLSDQAGWITGQILSVDGGRSRIHTRS